VLFLLAKIMRTKLRKIRRFSAKRETQILSTVFLLIIATPFLLPEKMPFFTKDIWEIIIFSSLSFIGLYAMYRCTKKLGSRHKETEEVLNYLGTINLQFAHVKSIFDDVKNFPENKKEFKLLLNSLAVKALGIINADWVLFRIVDSSTKQTLIEHRQTRGGAALQKNNRISNTVLLEEEFLENCVVIESSQKNLGIRSFCVLSAKAVNEHQKALMGVIINNLSVYYLLFVSLFYQKNPR